MNNYIKIYRGRSVVNYHEYIFVLHSYKYMLLNVNIHVCLSVLKLVYM